MNMKFVYTNQGIVGTYTLATNPSVYNGEEIALENNERNINAGLVQYNNGIYHLFQLGFQNIGTAQIAQLGTIFRAKSDITFYPMDEVRGTSESFVCRWTGNFSPKFSDAFWQSGYSLDFILEEK